MQRPKQVSIDAEAFFDFQSEVYAKHRTLYRATMDEATEAIINHTLKLRAEREAKEEGRDD